MVTLRESDIKRAIDDFLQYGQNAGRWVFLRLNAGEFIEVRGKTRRRIKGCPKGTADFLALRWFGYGHDGIMEGTSCRVIFIEVKSPTGRQSKDQIIFQGLVEAQGAEYHLIRSVEELQKKL